MNTSALIGQWNFPTLIKTEKVGESVEYFYRQWSIASTYPWTVLPSRVYKIVFSCKDGKWHKSEPIYGKIVPATDEDYEFDE